MYKLTTIKTPHNNMAIRISLLTLFLFNFLSNSIAQETIIKGKVHNWETDTVYVCELSFHSPYSSKVDYQIISNDGSFEFKWTDKKAPFVICIAPLSKTINNNKEALLFQNLTENHYYGQCIKFYKFGSTTYLIEPNTTLNVDVTLNTRIDTLSEEKAAYYRKLGADVKQDNTVRDFEETEIKFNGSSDNFNNTYYQQLFEKRIQLEDILEIYSSKNPQMALVNISLTLQNLLYDLELNKEKLSSTYYDYIKAELVFSAKMEYLKYLQFEQKDYLKEIIASKNLPESMLKFLAIDNSLINSITIRSEMYNEYIGFYLNFIMNVVENDYMDYHPFNSNKWKAVVDELPSQAVYYYIANHLLIVDKSSEFEEIYNWLKWRYPDGILNTELNEKYN